MGITHSSGHLYDEILISNPMLANIITHLQHI
jgi:hypothetical protein